MKPTRRVVHHDKAPDPFVQPCKSQESARDTLLFLAESIIFVKVVDVKVQASQYMGEAVECPIGHYEKSKGESLKTCFFDKFSRFKGPLQFGPITLVQATLGADHPTSVPGVGEMLVGTPVANARKSHLKWVLRGWCSNAKPLQELLRIVKYGTRMTEPKIRDLLLQTPCTLTMCPKNLQAHRDEIQMLARMILQGNLRPLQILATTQSEGLSLKKEANEAEILAAKQMKLGKTATDFLDLCIVKLNCSQLQEDFMEGLNVDETQNPQVGPEPSPTTFSSTLYLGTSQAVLPDAYSEPLMSWQRSGYTEVLPAWKPSGSTTPPAQQEPDQVSAQNPNPTSYFVPTSPKMAPQSPVYMPTSPVLTSQTQAPPSPTFALDDE